LVKKLRNAGQNILVNSRRVGKYFWKLYFVLQKLIFVKVKKQQF